MTPLATLLAERLAFKPCGSNNFGDVMRDEGVQWENARTKPITDALIKVVEAAELLRNPFIDVAICEQQFDEALASLRKLVGEGGK